MSQDDWNLLDSVALHLGIGDSGEELLYLINQTKAPARFSLPSDRSQIWQVICETTSTEILQKTIAKERLQPARSMSILHYRPAPPASRSGK